MQLLLAFIVAGLFSFAEDSRVWSSIAVPTNGVLTSKTFPVKDGIYGELVSIEMDEEAIEEIDEDDNSHYRIGFVSTSYLFFDNAILCDLIGYRINLVKRKLFLLYLALKVDYYPSLWA